jgi:hypothetical protein
MFWKGPFPPSLLGQQAAKPPITAGSLLTGHSPKNGLILGAENPMRCESGICQFPCPFSPPRRQSLRFDSDHFPNLLLLFGSSRKGIVQLGRDSGVQSRRSWIVDPSFTLIGGWGGGCFGRSCARHQACAMGYQISDWVSRRQSEQERAESDAVRSILRCSIVGGFAIS